MGGISDIVESLPFGVALFDRDGVCIRVNPALEAVASGETLLGRPLHSLVAACFGTERAAVAWEDFTQLMHDGTEQARREWPGADGACYDCRLCACSAEGAVAMLGVTDVSVHLDRRRELEERARVAGVLAEIETTLGYTTDFDDVLGALVADAPEGAGCDSAIAFAWRHGSWCVVHVRGVSRSLLGRTFDTAEVPCAERALVQRGPVSGEAPGTVFGDAHVLAVPLASSGEIAALLLLLGSRSEFSQVAVEFVDKLSTAASFALENARLQAAERETRAALQTALLGVVHDVPGVAFGHLYRSATRHAQVGGDFYELFEIGGGRVGVLMGDVSGKGISAASLAALVKTTVKIHARELGSPAAVLDRTNEVLVDECGSCSFVTAAYCVLDLDTGDLRYCFGGHPPGVVWRRDGSAALLSSPSPLLGAYRGLEYVEHATQLDNDDTLLLYTDGVTEARHAGEQYGQDRLLQLMGGMKVVDARDLPELVFEDVFAYVRGDMSDDMAILALSPTSVGADRPQQRLPF